MTEVKHTPGPWRTDEHGHIVCYPEGLSIGVLSRQLPEGELKANHRLIVAAPELLDALAGLIEQWNYFEASVGNQEEAYYKLAKYARPSWGKAIAAFNKATA